MLKCITGIDCIDAVNSQVVCDTITTKSKPIQYYDHISGVSKRSVFCMCMVFELNTQNRVMSDPYTSKAVIKV